MQSAAKGAKPAKTAQAAAQKAGREKVFIIGAGPSGLGTAFELVRKGDDHQLDIEMVDRNEQVGGLARTHDYKGYRFDVGPHRFFTKNDEIQALWEEVLGDDFITVPRLTRMLYRNRLFKYPIEARDALVKLGIGQAAASMLGYAHAQLFLRKMDPQSFEDWIVKNFGRKLYQAFFKTYTEKVWGIPCNEIGAEWAAQRIKNLNFAEVVRSAIAGKKRTSKAKSLVEKFYYPKKGAGQLYETLQDHVEKAGHHIHLNSSVSKIRHGNGRIDAVSFAKDGQETERPVDFLFSSMPLTHSIMALDPLPPAEIVEAAQKLYYRDHITANLIIDQKDLFPDNWIYVHSPEVKMARIANYNTFSDHMRPNPDHTAISVEYFVFKGDDVWNLSDDEIIELAKKEMDQVGLLKATDVLDGFVIRETESYPTYYMGHKEYHDRLKNYVKGFNNLELIGRGGMYKYDNQDHALYSGLLAARNYLAGDRLYDVWQINEDAEYQEEKKAEA